MVGWLLRLQSHGLLWQHHWLLLLRRAVVARQLLWLLRWLPPCRGRPNAAEMAGGLPLLPPRLHDCLNRACLQAVLLHKCHQLSSCWGAGFHFPSQVAT